MLSAKLSQGLLCECNNYDLLRRQEIIVISSLAFQETGFVHENSTLINVFFLLHLRIL